MVKIISLLLLVLIILVMTMTTITTIIAKFLRFYDTSSSFYRYLQSEPLSEITRFLDKETGVQRRQVTFLKSQDRSTESLCHSKSVA